MKERRPRGVSPRGVSPHVLRIDRGALQATDGVHYRSPIHSFILVSRSAKTGTQHCACARENTSMTGEAVVSRGIDK